MLFVFAVEIPRLQFSDAQNFHRLANNLADGEGFVRPVDLDLFDLRRPTAEYPPLFPAFLSLTSLAGGRSFRAHQVAASFLGAATVFVVGLAARQAAGERAGLAAGAIAAIHPMLVQPDAALMSESAYAPLVALLLLLVLRARRARTLVLWAAAGAAGGAAALARGEGLLLVLVCVVPAALLARDVEWRRRITAAAVAVLAAGAIVAPWTVRNVVTLDRFIPVSTNMWTVLGGANCAQTYTGEYAGWWLFSCFEAARAEGDTEAEMYANQQRRALEFMRENREQLPRLVAVRVLRVWGAYDLSQAELEATEGRSATWQRVGTLFSFGVFGLAAAGLVLLRRRAVPLWPFLSMALVATLVAAATYGNQRFRIQADVAAVIAAGVAVARLRGRGEEPAWRR